MTRWTLVLLTYSLINGLHGQAKLNVYLTGGISLSNFMNGEASNKMNIYGSDKLYFNGLSWATPFPGEITEADQYTNYKLSFFKDLLLGFSAGLEIEYFIKNDLAISPGFFLETKGMDLEYSSSTTDGSFTTGEQFSSKISNRYITLPILIRKYITPKKHLFIEAGVYSGYLISSSVDQINQKERFFNKSEVISSYYSEIELDDEGKTFTNSIDYGISIGTGFTKKIFERVILKAEVRTNFGLRKLDAKYNNEFESIPAAGGSTFTSTLVRATNYHSFNSNSKNLNSTLTVGFGYNIN